MPIMPIVLDTEGKFTIKPGKTKATSSGGFSLPDLKKYCPTPGSRGASLLPLPPAVFTEEDFLVEDNPEEYRKNFPHAGADAYRIIRVAKLGNLCVFYNYGGKGTFNLSVYRIDKTKREFLPILELHTGMADSLILTDILPFGGSGITLDSLMMSLPSPRLTSSVSASEYSRLLSEATRIGKDLASFLSNPAASELPIALRDEILQKVFLEKAASNIKDALQKWALGEIVDLNFEKAVADLNAAAAYANIVKNNPGSSMAKIQSLFGERMVRARLGEGATEAIRGFRSSVAGVAAAAGGAGAPAPAAVPAGHEAAAASGGGGTPGAAASAVALTPTPPSWCSPSSAPIAVGGAGAPSGRVLLMREMGAAAKAAEKAMDEVGTIHAARGPWILFWSLRRLLWRRIRSRGPLQMEVDLLTTCLD